MTEIYSLGGKREKQTEFLWTMENFQQTIKWPVTEYNF